METFANVILAFATARLCPKNFFTQYCIKGNSQKSILTSVHVVEGMDPDVVLRAGPEVCQLALDRATGEDGSVLAIAPLVG